jgi:Protein of unknown function DUF262/Protein of unknown function (DUF1524)
VLPTASLTIAGLLAGPYLLNVPVYQRPYSWGRDQAEQLLEDFLEAVGLGVNLEAEQDYFLGNILLMDAPGNVTARITPKMTVREFDVVDGQQRIVTLLTLFAVLRDLEGNTKKPIGRRVQSIISAQQGAPFFRTERLRLHLTSRDRPVFEKHVLDPGSTLESPVSDQLSPSETAIIAVRDLFVRELRELGEGERESLFEFVADRGYITLTISHDIDRAHRTFVVLNERGKKLQRNDILKADLLSRLSASNTSWGVKTWDDISEQLGADFEPFFAHLRTIYGQVRPQIVSGVRAIIRDVGGAELFLKTVFLPLAKSYALIRSGGDGTLPPQMTRHLTYLNRLDDGDWAPAAMLALKDWQSDPAAAERSLAEIERLAYLMRVLCMGSGKRVRRFSDVISALRSGSKLSAASPAFQLSREEVRNIAFHLRDLHKRSARACKLVLMRLNDEIDGTVSDVIPDHYTIEHVLPQRPAPTSEWRRWFPVAEERGKLVESLGNLALITQKQNDRARNASFEAKKKIYTAVEPGAPLLAVTRDILDVPEWHPLAVLDREEQLMQMIERVWRIDLALARPGPRTIPMPQADLAEQASATPPAAMQSRADR